MLVKIVARGTNRERDERGGFFHYWQWLWELQKAGNFGGSSQALKEAEPEQTKRVGPS